MYFKRATLHATRDYWQALQRLQKEIDRADAIVIGAGSGLSAAAGHTYSGTRFEENFADFIEKYAYKDMYSAGFYPYDSPEEYWAYWSRHIYLNRYAQDGGPVYENLMNAVKWKDYFVITTNVDHCFQRVGVDAQRLFYTQGDYGLFQCVKPCCQKTYDNEEMVRRMVVEQRDMSIPSELIPHCPECGRLMTMNLRSDSFFVEDEGWHKAAGNYADFLHKHACGHVLFLELGVGGNTPAIIKYPFWAMTKQNPKAIYACVNRGEAAVPREIRERSICMNEDIKRVICDLNEGIKACCKKAQVEGPADHEKK